MIYLAAGIIKRKALPSGSVDFLHILQRLYSSKVIPYPKNQGKPAAGDESATDIKKKDLSLLEKLKGYKSKVIPYPMKQGKPAAGDESPHNNSIPFGNTSKLGSDENALQQQQQQQQQQSSQQQQPPSGTPTGPNLFNLLFGNHLSLQPSMPPSQQLGMGHSKTGNFSTQNQVSPASAAPKSHIRQETDSIYSSADTYKENISSTMKSKLKNPSICQGKNYNDSKHESNVSVESQHNPEADKVLFLDYQNNKQWLKKLWDLDEVKYKKIWLYNIYGMFDKEVEKKWKKKKVSGRTVKFFKASGQGKNSADLTIVWLICGLDNKFPPSVSFTIVSGDETFKDFILYVGQQNRLLEVISPHPRKDYTDKNILENIIKIPDKKMKKNPRNLNNAIEKAGKCSKIVLHFKEKSVTLHNESSKNEKEFHFGNTVSSNEFSFALEIDPDAKKDTLEFILVFVVGTLCNKYNIKIYAPADHFLHGLIDLDIK